MEKIITGNDVSRSTAVTQTGIYAADAVELNPSVSGTLANKVAKIPTILTSETLDSINASFMDTSLVTFTAFRLGNMVSVSIEFTLGRALSSGTTTVFTLPSDFRPKNTIYGKLEGYSYIMTTSGEIAISGALPEASYTLIQMYCGS